MPFQAWILSHDTGYSERQVRLQWGHALSGMDTIAEVQRNRAACYASMGPCPFRHGYRRMQSLFCFVISASMGPCPFRHGYHRSRPARGERVFVLQWGHALSGMDTRLKQPRSGHSLCFNGAMPFQAWIPTVISAPKSTATKLQWGHALSGMDTLAILAIENFMVGLQWGHALSGMDTVPRHRNETSEQWLQWGHALSGMDTIIMPRTYRTYLQASMGPCPFRHGYYSGETGSNPINLLQWGHALSGMDTSPA